MTIPEKISAYFDRLVSEGRLRPGDRLPKYTDIGEQFKIPYASVQRAFKAMEQSGKIKIVNGVGSFLNGGDTLDVDFYLTGTTFPIREFQKISDEISEKNDLHLRIHVLNKPREIRTNVSGHKVVIAESDSWIKMDGCMMDYSAFPDFHDVMEQFTTFHGENSNLQLPFFKFSYQAAVNLTILREIGMDRTIHEVSSMNWWKELAVRCRSKGYSPADLSIDHASIWFFPIFQLSVILALCRNPDVSALFKAPFYATETGRRIFEMSRDMGKCPLLEPAFLQGKTALSLDTCSWFPVQCTSRFGADPEEFRILPVRAGDGRRIMHLSEAFLKTFANPSITQNEKERVWKFLKILLSKKYQKKLTAFSGIISPRKDMRPADYSWNTREDFMNFFPEKDALIYNSAILTKEKTAVLAVLFEHYERFGADPDAVCRWMDEKLYV